MSTKDYKCINFNQDFTCVSVGTETDFKIFNVDPFGECFELDSGVSTSQMLFATSLVALVGVGNKPVTSPRRLRILNTKKESNICELTFPTAVLSIKLNRKRLIAVLIDQIYIYDISCMKLLHTIETSPNPNGLCDLSSKDDSILIYPAPSSNITSPFNDQNNSNNNNNKKNENEIGTVILFDALNITPLNIIKAHKTELASISLNSNGSLVATASTKGTIIRVFNSFSGNKVGEFRRGSYPALVHSLIFNLNSSLLAISSDTETIHIFKLTNNLPIINPDTINEGNEDSTNDEEDNQTSDGEFEERILPRLSTSATSEPTPKRKTSITDKFLKNLPKNITSILEPTRDYAFLKISTDTNQTNHQLKKKHSLGFNGNNEIIIGNYDDGHIYTYAIPENGGECMLTKQYSFE